MTLIYPFPRIEGSEREFPALGPTASERRAELKPRFSNSKFSVIYQMDYTPASVGTSTLVGDWGGGARGYGRVRSKVGRDRCGLMGREPAAVTAQALDVP